MINYYYYEGDHPIGKPYMIMLGTHICVHIPTQAYDHIRAPYMCRVYTHM